MSNSDDQKRATDVDDGLLPSAVSFPVILPTAPLAEQPRGGPVDQDDPHRRTLEDAAQFHGMPGAEEAQNREEHRRKLIATVKALEDEMLNEVGQGMLEGAVAGVGLDLLLILLDREPLGGGSGFPLAPPPEASPALPARRPPHDLADNDFERFWEDRRWR